MNLKNNGRIAKKGLDKIHNGTIKLNIHISSKSLKVTTRIINCEGKRKGRERIYVNLLYWKGYINISS